MRAADVVSSLLERDFGFSKLFLPMPGGLDFPGSGLPALRREAVLHDALDDPGL